MRDESSAAERARWLAEVALALDQAKLIVERLGGSMQARAELKQRIEAARRTTHGLRLGADRRVARSSAPE